MSAKDVTKKAFDDVTEKQDFRFDVEVFTNSGRSFIGEAGSVKEASKLIRDRCGEDVFDARLHPTNDNPDASETAATHRWHGFHDGFVDAI